MIVHPLVLGAAPLSPQNRCETCRSRTLGGMLVLVPELVIGVAQSQGMNARSEASGGKSTSTYSRPLIRVLTLGDTSAPLRSTS